MDAQYKCKSEWRRQLVRDQSQPKVNGIDYLQVGPGEKTLSVFFIHNLPGSANPVPPLPAPKLTGPSVTIEGGVRIRGIHVTGVNSQDNVLTVTVDAAGDYSTYTLRLVNPDVPSKPPDGFDPQLSHVEFSFKVDCPSDFDCRVESVCPSEKLPAPPIDYLAKDYSSFRHLMLDQLSALMPDWKERNPADLQVALVELLAYVGDQLSYYQDAVATEAYLGTARKRISVRRHSRLLDYKMHDGCNARVWVQVEAGADDVLLPKGTTLLTRVQGRQPRIPPHSQAYPEALATGATVFESMHDLMLYEAHNSLPFYTWGDQQCCLPQGATRATLRGDLPDLKKGDVLIFEEVLSPTTGRPADADPTHRHPLRLSAVITGQRDPLNQQAVTEIQWDAEDALPFPLCLSSLTDSTHGQKNVDQVSVARGNVLLADHGYTFPRKELDEALEQLPLPPAEELYRPALKFAPVTQQGHMREGNNPNGRLLPVDLSASASAAMQWKMHDVRPVVQLFDARNPEEPWLPQQDLLRSGRFSREFVVETEEGGRARLRFGDDVLGQRPAAGLSLAAGYRVGNGSAGNVGRDAIFHVVTDLAAAVCARNPLAAQGGTEPEQIEQVRLYAPQAFRKQERAVTEVDYTQVAERHREIHRAAATFRWTGSWYTAFVTLQREAGRPVDSEFRAQMEAHLERYRVAGFDVDLNGPLFVPLDISLFVCVKSGYLASAVKQALLDVFSNRRLTRGGLGFFYSDNFTFGQPLYLSHIYKTALDVAGVSSVEVTRFQRWGKTANRELENGVLEAGRLEILRLDNDPNFPENGRLELEMGGGR